MANDIRERAKEILKVVPPLGQQINSTGSTAALFTKLIAAFVLVCTLTAALGAFSIFQLGGLNGTVTSRRGRPRRGVGGVELGATGAGVGVAVAPAGSLDREPGCRRWGRRRSDRSRRSRSRPWASGRRATARWRRRRASSGGRAGTGSPRGRRPRRRRRRRTSAGRPGRSPPSATRAPGCRTSTGDRGPTSPPTST